MQSQKLKDLLTQLHDALDDTEVDRETLDLARQLDTDIHRLLDRDADASDPTPSIELVRRIEAEFAARHPVAQRVLREIGDRLASMGI